MSNMNQSGSSNPDTTHPDYPQQRPFYVDIIGVVAGILMFFGVGLWWVKLYSPAQVNMTLYAIVTGGFGVSAFIWLVCYGQWLIVSSHQRKKRLQAHRDKAKDTYQLGHVRQDMDARR